jgi:hypothetical protein
MGMKLTHWFAIALVAFACIWIANNVKFVGNIVG